MFPQKPMAVNVKRLKFNVSQPRNRMVFGKRKDWQDDYDEDYVGRADRREKIGRLRHWLHLLVLSLIGLLVLGGIAMVGGKTMIEKTLTSLASAT